MCRSQGPPLTTGPTAYQGTQVNQPSTTHISNMELWNTCSVDHITPNNATLTLTSTRLLVTGGAQ